MKKLVSLLSLTLVAGAMASQPVMAQGTTSKQDPKQQPTKQQPTKPATKPVLHKQLADTVKKGQTAMQHKANADTVKKGQTAVKHTRRHHKTSSKKPVVKKPVEK